MDSSLREQVPVHGDMLPSFNVVSSGIVSSSEIRGGGGGVPMLVPCAKEFLQ